MTSWFSATPLRLLAIFAAILLAGKAAETGQPHLLRQILITDSLEEAPKLAPIDQGGLVSLAPNLGFFNRAELIKKLAAGKNLPIDERLLAAIAQVVEMFARQNDFPAAVAVIPPQNIAGGVVRVALLLGKVRNIRVEGNQWFSESLLREKLRMEQGRAVRISELEPALNWTNNSPFRKVKVHLEPVPDTGEVDVYIGVRDQAPLRLTASYDNTGNEVLGENRYVAAVSYANVWGKDHQATYQFLTTDKPKDFTGHGLEYRVPLPTRHSLLLGGSFMTVNPTFLDGLFTQKGRSITADAKYVLPFVRKGWQGEATGGFAFKQSNNNLEFGGTEVHSGATDTFGTTLSAAALREDARGRWFASVNVFASPGELNSRSQQSDYDQSRPGSHPRFAYGQFSLQRQTRLTPDLTSTLRASVQFASGNLLPSEQFSLGGQSSIRGYKERVVSGDGGYSATHELQLRLPSMKLGKKLPAMDTAGVAFFDYGRGIIKHPFVGQNKADYLASVGVGVRASVGNTLSLSFDLARQLEEVELPGEPHHRGHIRVTVSY